MQKKTGAFLWITAIAAVAILAANPLPASAAWGNQFGLTYPRLGSSVAAEDLGQAVCQTSDGGYLAVGYTTYNLLDGGGPWVIKLDKDGGIQWQKVYLSASADRFLGVAQAGDGSYYLAGHTVSMSSGDNDLWLMKLDIDGNILWQKAVGDAKWNTGRALSPTPDGGVLVSGYVEDIATEDMSTADAWAVKFDADGNIAWQKQYGDATTGSAACFAMTGLDDGGAVMAGAFAATGFESGFAWLARLGPSGDVQWQKGVGHRASLSALSLRSVAALSDGGLIAAGCVENQEEEMADFWVARFDSGGSLIWHQMLRRDQGLDEARGVIQTPDGGFIVAGNIDIGKTPAAALVKLDASGRIQWQRKWVSSGAITEAAELKPSVHGGAVLVGTVSAGAGDADMMVLHVDGDGSLTTDCPRGSFEAISEFSAFTTEAEEKSTPAVTADSGHTAKDTAAQAQDTSATGCN